MTRVVVDASVVVKWFIPEPDSDAAYVLLQAIKSGELVALAPELVLSEVANALWKRVGREELTVRDASEIIQSLVESPLHIEPTAPLVETALAIALETGCTVYDALYIALAEQTNGSVATSDRKLMRRMARTAYAARLRVI